jgi:D-aminopeptidase
MTNVRSINPFVGETNDGALNAIRTRPVAAEDVRAALGNASAGAVEEGAVGAGAGTVAFGWKGGIGTSSRLLPASLGGWTVGVLVQSNYGGVLQILGAPVGKELGRYAFRQHVDTAANRDRDGEAGNDRAAIGSAADGDGSIMIVVATDAPLSDRNLRRIAARAMVGLSRTGSSASNGSGDYVVAFSSNARVRRPWDARRLSTEELANEETSALFQAVAEATEEAIYNSLLKATTVTSNGRTVEALPIDRVKEILARYRVNER